MHPDRKPQPVKEVGQRVEHFQLPDRKKSRCAEDRAQHGVRKKRTHADKELCTEICDLLMNDVACGIPESKKANVKYLQFEQPAEEQMPSLVNDDAGKRQRCNHGSRDEKHGKLLFAGFI